MKRTWGGALRRRLGQLSLAGLTVLFGLSLASGASADDRFSATVLVSPHEQYLGDSAGQVFTFTITNTGTTSRIRAVEITPPAGWTVLSCPSAPTGWTATVTRRGRCRYSDSADANDLVPGASSSAFTLRAATATGTENRDGKWDVYVSRDRLLTDPDMTSATGVSTGARSVTAYSFQITDAVVAASSPAPGSACPPANREAITGSTQTIVICGRNRTTATRTPVSVWSSLGGTFVSSPGTFSSGPIAPTGSPVVLGSWNGATINSTTGTGYTVVATVGSRADRTSPVTTLTGYEATNHPPDAVNDTDTTNEDTNKTVDVLANDSDLDGDSFSVTAVTQPDNGGTVTNNGTNVTFNVGSSFQDLDTGGSRQSSFTYTITDANGATDTATVTMTVTGVEDPPNAVDDSDSTNEDTAKTVDVLANDTDPDDTLTVTSVDTTGTSGSVTITNSGADVSYDPNGQFDDLDAGDSEQDTFTYTVSDGNTTDTATVTMTVTGVEDAPNAVDDSDTTNEDTNKTVNVLANDVDPDDTLTITGVGTPDNGGTVTNNGTDVTFNVGSAFQDLDTGQTRQSSFTYTVSDGNSTDTATVTITVTGVEDPPNAVDDSDSTNEDTAKTVNVLANDTDPDDTLTVTAVGSPTNGGSVTNNGTDITFTPGASFQDLDTGDTRQTSFTYTISDGNSTDTATVTVTVTGVNDVPVAVDDTDTTNEDTSKVVDVLANDTDPDDVLAVSVVTAPDNGGTVTANGNNVTFNPGSAFQDLDTGQTRQTTFTYKATDGTVESNSATVTITVTGVEDAPNAVDDTDTTNENTAKNVNVLANDVDPDDTLTVTAVGSPTNGGSVTNNGTDVTFTPGASFQDLASGETRQSSFTYTVSDGNSTDAATVTMTVTGANDAPVANDATVAIDENSPNGTAVHTVTFTDAEPGDSHTFTIDSGNTGGAFAINASTGAITVADSSDVDFETNPQFILGVQVCDNGVPVLCDPATITVNLSPVNEAPVVDAATVSLAENSPNGTAVHTVTFTEPDAGQGQSHTFAITAGNTGGAFAINSGTGAITVANSAALDFETTPQFNLTVQVTDDGIPGMSGTATITVNLTNAGEAPVITAPTSIAAEHEQPEVLTGISVADQDGGTLTFTMAVDDGTLTVDTTVPGGVTAGNVTGNGTASVTLTGTQTQINNTLADSDGVTYVSDTGFTGISDTLQLTLTDSTALSDTESVTITFNAAPVAAAQSTSTNEDTAKLITLSGSDADDEALTFSIVTGPTNGSLGVVSAANCAPVDTCTATVTYTPDAQYNGPDSFTFKVNDGTSDSNTATVSITVTAVNDAPTAAAQSLSSNEDDPKVIVLSGSDLDDNALTFSIVTGPVNGSLGLIGTPDCTAVNTCTATVTYTPNANYNGPDSFTFKVNDGTVDSNVATVSITVLPVNDVPTAAAQATSTNEDTAKVITLSGSDPEDSNLTFSIVTGPTNGSLGAVGTPDCTATNVCTATVTYTPDAQYSGPDSFTFKVNDGTVDSNTATVSITVNPVNDAPEITLSGSTPSYTENGTPATVDGSLTVADVDDTQLVSGSVTITAGSVAGDTLAFTPIGGITDTNAAADVLTLSGTTTVANWQTALRSVTFSSTSENPTNASRTVTFTVNDGDTNSAPVGKSVAVVPVNDAPELTQPDAAALNYTENATTQVAPNITANDVDSTNLVGATIQITGNYQNGQDVLSLGTNPQNGITAAAFNTATGTLTLTGSSSVANYQTALRDVRYTNTSEDPNTSQRTVSFFVDDGPGPNDISNTVTRLINVVRVNDAPVGVAESFDALANTRLVVGTTSSGPRISTSGNVLTNDTDVDTPQGNLTAVSVTKSSTQCPGCNNVVINADGSFQYDPPQGYTGVDTFTYTVNDNDTGDSPSPAQTGTGTVTINVQGPIVWYIDGDAGAPPAGQGGRSHSPFNTLIDLNTGGGADVKDGNGDILFVYSSAASYAGGIVLETNQKLWGEPFSLDVDPNGTLPLQNDLVPAGGSNPVVNNSSGGGDAVTLDDGVNVQRINVTSANDAAFFGPAVTNATIGTTTGDCAVSGAGGAELLLSGTANGTIDFRCNITNTAGRAVDISGRSGGAVNIPGTVSDPAGGSGSGVILSSNVGATVAFTGDVDLDTGTNAAFTATGGGTVTSTHANSTLVTTTGTALNVTGTFIGANDLTFLSISSNGAANGIVLNNTGSAGNLVVTGNAGSCTSAATCTGGAIQNAVVGISLTSTTSPSFDQMAILNTSSHGVGGTDVSNFTFTDGKIDNSGTGGGVDTANIAFNTVAATNENNVDGVVTITGNTLTNARYHGIDIFNFSGTIADATISNNTITSSTSVATSIGGGIRWITRGAAGNAADLTKATINNNVINNFPSGVGLQVQCGNANNEAAPAADCGTAGSGTNIVNITNNKINGNGLGSTVKTGAEGMIALVNGVGQGNFNITGNEVRQNTGTSISSSAFGDAVVTETISSNTVVSNNTVGSQGIGIGTSTTGGFVTNTPNMTATISSNNVSQTDGNGILAVARDSSAGVLKVKVLNNVVAAPLAGVRQGIRIDAGNSAGADNDVCLQISGNTSAPTVGQPAALGIGLRKEGTSTTVNAFGIVGFTPSGSPNGPSAVTYVNSQNPSGGGTLLISANDGFTSCPSF